MLICHFRFFYAVSQLNLMLIACTSFFFNDTATTEIYTLSLHDALPICSGWLWPVDAKGEPLKATSYMAVGFYVAKYVNKKSDMDLAAKGLGAKEWNNSLKTKLSLLPKKLFRIRMSRNFGMKMLT